MTALQPLTGSRVLVTGASGFIGSSAALRLHAEGVQVVALEHTPGKADTLRRAGIEVVQGDLADHDGMRALCNRGLDGVLHIGAWLRGRPAHRYLRINVEATEQLARAAAESGIRRFIYTSSIMAYGLHGDRDINEDAPLRTYGDPYGDSKIVAEAALRRAANETGLDVVIVRPGMVYGPASPGWAIRLARWARQGTLPLVDGGRGMACPVYIDNLVDLLVLCLNHPAASGETFNAVDDGAVPLRDFLGAYLAMIPTERAVHAPGWLVRGAATLLDPFFPDYSLRYLADKLHGTGVIRSEKARILLGWEPRISLSEGLVRTEAWLRDAGWIPPR